MSYTDLAWQVPAVFSAVPMVHRLLPFRLPARALPLFYFIVALVVMAMPGYVCLSLGAAGLVAMIHVRIGENLSAADPPDMTEVANKLALAWDYIVTHLPGRSVTAKQDASLDDILEDGNQEFSEPPPAPEGRVAQHIPHLD